MERVSAHSPLREPRMVERGRYEAAEHGSGAAGVNFLSPRRERPLQRRSMLVLPEAPVVRLGRSKVVTRILSVLVRMHMDGFFVGKRKGPWGRFRRDCQPGNLGG